MNTTSLVAHSGLLTVSAAGFQLRDAILDRGDYAAGLQDWLVVAHIIETSIFEQTNIEAAYEALKRRHGTDSIRLLFDPGWKESLLIVDPEHGEDLAYQASQIATDLRRGIHLDPPRYNQAVDAQVEITWQAANLPDRIDWLLKADLSLGHVIDDECPTAAYAAIAADQRL
jgi:hypothetical protein